MYHTCTTMWYMWYKYEMYHKNVVHCFINNVFKISFLHFLTSGVVLNLNLSCMGSETKILESMMKFWNDSEWTQAEQGVFGPIAWTGPRLCPMACSNRPASGPSVRRHRLPTDVYYPNNTVGIQSYQFKI